MLKTQEAPNPMLSLQVVPRTGVDAYRLLRAKVIHGAHTWTWKNKAKTRLTRNSNPKRGYIEVGKADGVVVAEIHPARAEDTWFFVEKFIGRLVAWFPSEITAINLQFRDAPLKAPRRRRKST